MPSFSLARDTYGSNMSEPRARQSMSRGAAVGKVLNLRASSPIRRVSCVGIGVFPTKTPCVCVCHGDNGITPCDVRPSVGFACDGSVVS